MEAFLALVYDCINQTALAPESKKYLGQLIAQALALYVEIVISVSNTLVGVYEALKIGICCAMLIFIAFMVITTHCILVEKAKIRAVKDYIEEKLFEEAKAALNDPRFKYRETNDKNTSTEK